MFADDIFMLFEHFAYKVLSFFYIKSTFIAMSILRPYLINKMLHNLFIFSLTSVFVNQLRNLNSFFIFSLDEDFL